MGGVQIIVYGADFGLALPAEMTAAGFASQGGSIGLNPENSATAHRAMSHNLADNTLKISSGTLYFWQGDDSLGGKGEQGQCVSMRVNGGFDLCKRLWCGAEPIALADGKEVLVAYP